MRYLKFKGQKVGITTDRIQEDDRDPELYYYELRRDEDRPYLPYMIEESVQADHFWGTMVAEAPIEFNQGDFHTLSEDLGHKLAEKFGLLPA
ncbi:LPD28 domain-containing protein [Tumebacillus lipolyticus]|uniref:LPD28 domain-containing protein n=1 Tax=Tumebacillus lipolyticus TaxID=1280370 RepID=A0ABW4ZRP1_9BACL